MSEAFTDLCVEPWSAPTAARFAIEDDDYVLKIRRSDFYDVHRVRLCIYDGRCTTLEMFLNEADRSIIGLTVVGCDGARPYHSPTVDKIERDVVPIISARHLGPSLELPVSCAIKADGLSVGFGQLQAPAHINACGATLFSLVDGRLVGFSHSGDFGATGAFQRYFA